MSESNIHPCKSLGRGYFWWPIILFAAIAYFTPAIDLTMSNYFYDQAVGDFTAGSAFLAIRQFGVIPALLLAVSATLFLGLTFIVTQWRRWRPYALLLILPMVLGAGVITHTLMKDHWGRPRPRQVENFGGDMPYRPFYQPNFSLKVQPFKSFPCGHCTMGFYFFAVALLGRRLNSPWIFGAGLAIALLLGVALSAARIAQGGHFFSDILGGALVMWLTCLCCDWVLYGHEEQREIQREG